MSMGAVVSDIDTAISQWHKRSLQHRKAADHDFKKAEEVLSGGTGAKQNTTITLRN